jgi:hypothetical protein
MAAGTYDLSTPVDKSAARQYTQQGVVPVRRVITLADLTSVKGSAPASGDDFNVMFLDQGSVVLGVYLRTMVPVAGGSVSSPTVSLADESSSTAGFLALTSVSAAANTLVAGDGVFLQAATAPYALTGGKSFMSDDDAIKMTLGGTWTGATVGTFEVIALVLNIGTSLTL